MGSVFVTGATGFIGNRLVRQLSQQGESVTCLVRSSSDRSELEPYQPRFVVADLTDASSLAQHLSGADTVYHLAGATKALRKSDFQRTNVVAARALAQVCAQQSSPPTFIHVSSLAAAGPSTLQRPRRESDQPAPVSVYGRSKLDGELAVRKFADALPITIVRPPIVLGPGDRDGFEMFKGIHQLSIHLVPGFANHRFSAIHVDDLCHAFIELSSSGKRLTAETDDDQGVYFASSPETPTYAELGQMIGDALEVSKVHLLRSPLALIWMLSAINEGISQIRRRTHILNLDKAREASAGSWSCSAEKLLSETSFKFDADLQQRLNETAQWYFEQGWLKPKRHK